MKYDFAKLLACVFLFSSLVACAPARPVADVQPHVGQTAGPIAKIPGDYVEEFSEVQSQDYYYVGPDGRAVYDNSVIYRTRKNGKVTEKRYKDMASFYESEEGGKYKKRHEQEVAAQELRRTYGSTLASIVEEVDACLSSGAAIRVQNILDNHKSELLRNTPFLGVLLKRYHYQRFPVSAWVPTNTDYRTPSDSLVAGTAMTLKIRLLRLAAESRDSSLIPDIKSYIDDPCHVFDESGKARRLVQEEAYEALAAITGAPSSADGA